MPVQMEKGGGSVGSLYVHEYELVLIKGMHVVARKMLTSEQEFYDSCGFKMGKEGSRSQR